MKLRFNLIFKIYLKSTVKLYNHIPCIEFGQCDIYNIKINK